MKTLPIIELEEIHLNVLWGDLFLAILNNEKESILENLKALKCKIDQSHFKFAEEISQKSSFLAISIIALYNSNSNENDFEFLLSILANEKFIGTLLLSLQSLIPCILNCHLILKPSQKVEGRKVQSFIEELSHLSLTHKSTVQKFFEALYLDFDFDKSATMINQLEQDIHNDFFVGGLKESLLESSKFFFFDTYCKLYKNFTFEKASKYLNLNTDETEMWIVNFFQKFQIEAKITPEKSLVELKKIKPNFNSQILDTNRVLSEKISLLLKNIDKLA